jgi:hypothetical protein
MLQIDRLKNILLTPKTEWPAIAGETATVQSLYVGYIMLLAAIGPVAMALRFGFLGVGITFAIVNYVLSLAVVYVLALVIDAIAPSFGGEKSFIQSLKLVAYSFTAAWLAGVFHLLGGIGGLLALVASIYSIYTLYLGAPVMKKCSQDKAVVFTIVVVVLAILISGVLSWLLYSIMGGGSMYPMGMDLMQR